MDGVDGGVKISGVFSGLIAILALAVSLASAGWSVFAYWKSSEIRPLEYEGITFIDDDGVVQIALEVTLANLAYGEYDDVARDQELVLHSGDRMLRFVAREAASLRERTLSEEGVPEALQYPCREAGNIVVACVISETPVVSLPAGGVVTTYPVFELAESNCGLDDCSALTLPQLAGFLTEQTTVTYKVITMRDGEHNRPCHLAVTRDGVDYLASSRWYNPRCREAMT